MVVRMLMIMLTVVEEASRQSADSKSDNQLDDFKNQRVAKTNALVSAMFCLTSARV
jgi:hypothetical protein